METNSLYINKRKINYRFFNLEYLDKDTCLVFLHDGLGSVKQWKDFPLKTGNDLKLPVFLYDRFGHGDSGASMKKRNKNFFKREAEYLNSILNKLKINIKIILIGCSDGGTIALTYAAMFPEKVAGIVAVAAHTFVEDKTVLGIKKISGNFKKGNLKKELIKYHSDKTDVLFKNWTELWLSNNFREWNIFPGLKKIKCPLLAIQGDRDEYGTVAQLNSILKYVKSECAVKLIKNAGHFPHIEKEKYVIGLIREFICNKLSSFFERPPSV